MFMFENQVKIQTKKRQIKSLETDIKMKLKNNTKFFSFSSLSIYEHF